MEWLGGEELIGRILGGCELRRYLGSGAMSAVYLGHQASLDREVAVKILPRSVATVSGYGARFSKEAKILGLLEHPHIVPVYDYGISDGISFIVMRLMTGGSLSARMNQQRLPVAATLVLIEELADALDYAHNRGIVHRDIKASNVLFDQRGRGYLADFGIAKLLDASETQTTPTNQFGTPAYMAPELWRDEEPSALADIYALGVLTYLLLSGSLPFDATSPYALMAMHLTKRHTPLGQLDPSIPAAADEVVDRALDKEPTERYASAGAFANALKSAFAQPAVPSRAGMGQRLYQTPDTSEVAPQYAAENTASPPNGDRVPPLPPGRSRFLPFVAAGVVLGIALVIGALSRGAGFGSNVTLTPIAAIRTSTSTDTPTPTESPSPTVTSTFTPTPSPTGTASATPTSTSTFTPTATLTATMTASSSPTVSETLSPTPTDSATRVPSSVPALTPTSTLQIALPQTSNEPESISSTGTLSERRLSVVVRREWTQGDVVDIWLHSRDFDAKVWLADAEGTELADNDDCSGGTTDACIQKHTVAMTGTYLITISSFQAGATGSYELVVTSYGVCGRMPIVVVSVPVANLRLQPNVTSRIIEMPALNRCFTVLGRTANSVWWQVASADGDLGWLSTATVTIVGDLSSVPIADP